MSIADAPLWSWTDLCSALKQEQSSGPSIQGISIDTRTLVRGDLFIALSGKARPEFNILKDSGRDGHDFIPDAIEKGSVAIVSTGSQELTVPQLRCEDTLSGLWDIARHRRNQLACPVIAVTGSSGKTTLKNFLSQALECGANEESLNNHIGVPLSIARMPQDANYAVLEIGMNHPGEIKPLAQLARPHVAVVLNVLNAHIGNFSDVAALREEKLSIGEGVLKGGSLIVPQDLHTEAESRFPQLDVRTFGQEDSAYVRFAMVNENRVKIVAGDTSFECDIPGGGEHRGATLCAAAATLEAMHENPARLNSISKESLPGRGKVFDAGGIRIIDESYNANPDSMRKCLQHLAHQNGKRRIAVIGDMAELGHRTGELHSSLVPELSRLDGVLCIGPSMQRHVYQHLRREIQWGSFESVNGVIEFFKQTLQVGDVVLIKGSNTVFWKHNFVPSLVGTLITESEAT